MKHQSPIEQAGPEPIDLDVDALSTPDGARHAEGGEVERLRRLVERQFHVVKVERVCRISERQIEGAEGIHYVSVVRANGQRKLAGEAFRLSPASLRWPFAC